MERPQGEVVTECLHQVTPQFVDHVRADEIHQRGAGEHAVLHRFRLGGRRAHPGLATVEARGLVEREPTVVQLDVDDRPGTHPHPPRVLGKLFVRGQRAGLGHQVGGVAGPPLGHRPAAEHCDAGGAVDGRDAADARRRAEGVPVLDVVPDPPVMNDVVELDDRVVVRAQEGLRLPLRGRLVQRSHHVLVDVRATEGGG